MSIINNNYTKLILAIFLSAFVSGCGGVDSRVDSVKSPYYTNKPQKVLIFSVAEQKILSSSLNNNLSVLLKACSVEPFFMSYQPNLNENDYLKIAKETINSEHIDNVMYIRLLQSRRQTISRNGLVMSDRIVDAKFETTITDLSGKKLWKALAIVRPESDLIDEPESGHELAIDIVGRMESDGVLPTSCIHLEKSLQPLYRWEKQ